MTTITRFCANFIEAGWLLAVVVVAVFLNPFSEQVFEPDKVALFRLLVILMVAAWGIRNLELRTRAGGENRWQKGWVGLILSRLQATVRDAPLTLLAGLVLLVYIVSTVASISPGVSWWGSYQRTQGTYTFLSYLGLFFLVLVGLQRDDQLQRLIAVLLITSFPVALYGVLQHYGLSMLQFSEAGVEARVISTLGNAIFLGAYLAMVMPLTLWRLLEVGGQWPRASARALVAGVLYGGLFLLQFAAFLFAQSRGPFAGFVVEIIVFLLLIGLVRRSRRWALAGILLTLLAVVGLLILNSPGLAPDALPYLGRFRGFLESPEVRARAEAWATVLETVGADPTRVILGYGPETMKPVFTKFMPAELWVLQGGGEYGTFDRAHNAVFDALYAKGVLGVVAYLSLYGTVFFVALRRLGLAESRRRAMTLGVLLVGGIALGLLVPWLWRGDLVFAGIGMPAGLVAGMLLYLFARVIVLPSVEPPLNEERGLLLAALLAAIIGHFVETQTGIGIAATHSYFWLYAALMILLGSGRIEASRIAHPDENHTEVRAARGRQRTARSRRGRRRDQGFAGSLAGEGLENVVANGLLVAALLGMLSYAFVHGFRTSGTGLAAQVLIWATWVFAGAVVLLESDRSGVPATGLGGSAFAYGLTSLVWLVPFSLYHRMNAQTLERLSASYIVFVVWFLLTVVSIAVALKWRINDTSQSRLKAERLVLYAAIGLLAFGWGWRVDVARVRADIYEKIGKTAMNAGYWDQAIANLQKAVNLQPKQDQYYIYLGGAYAEQARLASDQAVKDDWMVRARELFERAWSIAPRDSDHPKQLGLAYRIWAEWAADSASRRQRLEQSVHYYQTAVDLNPQNPDLRLELADAYFALGQDDEALTHYQHAVEIGSPNHLGRAYAGLGDVYLVRDQYEDAIEAYNNAMQRGRDKQEVLDARVRAAGNRPADLEARESLALAYAAANRTDDALKELEAALAAVSTAEQRAEVEQLMALVDEE